MIIIAGNSHPELAQAIASKLSAPLVSSNIKKFNDQELHVQIDANLKDQDVVIIQSTSPPVNDHLMELLFIADTAKRAGASRIIAVIPYFGYSRQDKATSPFGSTPANLVARLLETAGIDKIITLDLHSQVIEEFFKIEMQNLSPLSLFMPFLRNIDNCIVVTPDAGGLQRAKALASTLKLDLAVINKSRTSKGSYGMEKIRGDVQGKNCLLIDDIIDSGGTLCGAGKLLLEQGAKSIRAYVTHGIFSGKPPEELALKLFNEFYITDSIKQFYTVDRIKVIPIAGFIASSLKGQPSRPLHEKHRSTYF
jgi:ribose-phosphate pyrophosphokinase